MKNKVISIIGLFLPLLSFAQINFFGSRGGSYGGGVSGYGGGGYGGGGAAVQAPVRSINDVIRVLDTLIGWAQAILFVIVAIMVLYAAYLYVLGQGESKTAKAKEVLIYAVVGTVIALLSYAVVPVVCNLLGTSCG